jgi:iron-sulfur cluster assembly protein
MSIELTDKAAAKINRTLEEHDMDPERGYLRIGVRGGGCSGFSYTLELTDELDQDEQTFQSAGVNIACSKENLQFLDGLTVDFDDSELRSGFIFDNPNAARRCGCGASFAV